MKTMELKACKILEEFLEEELGDYDIKWRIDETELYDESTVYIDVTIFTETKNEKCLNFRILDGNYPTVEICMYEDTYEETCTYDYKVKYFWQKVLDWPGENC